MNVCSNNKNLNVVAGVGGYDGDGDITRPDNLEAFSEYVLAQTDGSGVHFVMADGVSIMFFLLRSKYHVLVL